MPADLYHTLLEPRLRAAGSRDVVILRVSCRGSHQGAPAEALIDLMDFYDEETGYLPQKVERLGGFYSTPGYCTEYLYLYLATDLTPSPLQAEDTESIQLTRVPPSQIPELIDSGTICDAKSIAGLLIYLKHRQA